MHDKNITNCSKFAALYIEYFDIIDTFKSHIVLRIHLIRTTIGNRLNTFGFILLLTTETFNVN